MRFTTLILSRFVECRLELKDAQFGGVGKRDEEMRLPGAHEHIADGSIEPHAARLLLRTGRERAFSRVRLRIDVRREVFADSGMCGARKRRREPHVGAQVGERVHVAQTQSAVGEGEREQLRVARERHPHGHQAPAESLRDQEAPVHREHGHRAFGALGNTRAGGDAPAAPSALTRRWDR